MLLGQLGPPLRVSLYPDPLWVSKLHNPASLSRRPFDTPTKPFLDYAPPGGSLFSGDPTVPSPTLSRVRRRLRVLGLDTPGGIARAITVPACAVCAGSVPALAAVGAALPAGVLYAGFLTHVALLPLAPLNVALLWRSYRAHGRKGGLILGSTGVALILLHMTFHFGAFESVLGQFHRYLDTLPHRFNGLPAHWLLFELPIWSGAGLLATGTFLDIRARWEARSRVVDCRSPEEYWEKVLTGVHPGLRESRWALSVVPSPPRCKLCSAPFAGPGRLLMRLIGKAQSPKNPRFCDSCLSKAPIGGAELEVSLLFADVRGSTELAERSTPSDFSHAMRSFYEIATDVLTEHDALIDKFVGDEVVALFIPAFAGPVHAARAIDAATALLTATGGGLGGPQLSIGVGVHTGIAYVGLLGAEGGVADLTALGDTVNVAKRLSSSARAGELVVSRAALLAAKLDPEAVGCMPLELKGREEPVEAAILETGADLESASTP